MGDELRVEQQGALATVTINRPAVHNAITLEVWRELAEVFRQLATRPEVRVVILRGAGTQAFSAGADVAEFPTHRYSRAAARTYHQTMQAALEAIETLDRPVLALIFGFALGAACALACACDLRLAAENARIGVPAARLGLTLGLRDTQRLVSLVGIGRAADLLLTGRILSAAEALAVGLVDRVYPVATAEAEARALATEIAAQAPVALRQAKRALRLLLRNPSLSGVDETEASIEWAETQDFAEGIRAFLERRRPVFQGR